jgi:hypothetical protein
MNTKDFEQQLKDAFGNWKTALEEMRVQFTLGKMDAADTFEKQKNQLRSFIEVIKKNTDKATDIAEKQAEELKVKLEELNVQLHLGKAETKEAFEAQRKKIDLALQEVHNAAKLAYQGNYGYMMELFDHNTKAIQTSLEIAQLQFTLAKMDAKDEAEKLRNEIASKVQDLQNHSQQLVSITKENVEQMSKQWQDGIAKMNAWIQDFYKK